ncbi:alpha/beta fold hydrolase [Micromonospora sp. NPDC000089]|uniref:alpha/beta fold hydrolase n=1 Tax=unclassified Micromonospora TaxID=2617518 RepID=UPI0036C7752E
MTTYLLIPGAGGAAWYWHRLVPELRRHGHDAIAVDLPAADDGTGLREYADAVVDAAGQPRRDDLVVVGQSMGGLTAPLICDLLPVSRLVLVNAMIPSPGETGDEWWTNTAQDQARRACDAREGRSPEGPFDPLVYLFHDVPEDIAKEAMAAEPPQSATPFQQPWPLEAWPDVPTVVLSSRDDQLFPLEFQIRVARRRLGITPETLPGGHLVALSRPEELAAALV